MALFSFRHSVKTFSEKCVSESRIAKAGQTLAHLRYITRRQAAREVICKRLNGGDIETTAILAEQEAQRRKGRVCERFVIALPVEATAEQRSALALAYAQRLSKGIAGFVIGIHDQNGNDKNNPHAHFVFFDVQQKSGGRGRPKSVLGLARKNAIETSAELWANLHNEMMKSWGFGPGSNITHLSFADRGIDKVPTIHEGAGARHLNAKTNTPKPKWKHIDQGHSRAEANQIIREINHLKEKDNERNNRLGKDNAPDRAERCSIGPQQRERDSRDSASAKRTGPPFFGGQESFETGQTVSRAAKRKPPPYSRNSKLYQKQKQPTEPNVYIRVRRSFHRRHSIRRIFRELVMMRDTLKSRFLLNGRQNRSHQKQMQYSNFPRHTKKPRQIGRAVRDNCER
ncbi:MobA/MobL family protein [Profundibacter sp.]